MLEFCQMNREREIFLEALEQPTQEARAAFIEQATAGDVDRRHTFRRKGTAIVGTRWDAADDKGSRAADTIHPIAIEHAGFWRNAAVDQHRQGSGLHSHEVP